MQQNEATEEPNETSVVTEESNYQLTAAEVNRIWVDALALSRAAGITVEANCFLSPVSEDINRDQIAKRGDHLYFIPQHRNILHTVLLAHIEGNIEFAKVSSIIY